MYVCLAVVFQALGQTHSGSMGQCVPGMYRSEVGGRYRKWQQNGCAPPGSFHNVPVFSTWLSDSGTKPAAKETERRRERKGGNSVSDRAPEAELYMATYIDW